MQHISTVVLTWFCYLSPPSKPSKNCWRGENITLTSCVRVDEVIRGEDAQQPEPSALCKTVDLLIDTS